MGWPYNNLIEGERTTVHCNVEAARGFKTPDGRERFTRAEMETLNLRGSSLYRQHDLNHRIGQIIDHWVDEQGLRIMAEITDKVVIDDIDSGGQLDGFIVRYGNATVLRRHMKLPSSDKRSHSKIK